MTVSSTTNEATFQGNGVAQIFPLPFRFFSNSDIIVELVSEDTGSVTPQTIGTHYTLSGAGDPEIDGNATGELTMLSPVAVGFSLFVRRVLPLTQPTDIINQGRYFPEIHETVFDRLLMQIQQGIGSLGKALRVVPSEPNPAFLPLINARANRLLSFDSEGNPIAVAPASGSASELAIDLANTTDPAKGVALLGYKGRTLDDKLKEWISVTDFGVVADGVTDNTAAYSAMIAALPAGLTIYWPKGTYVGDFISSKPFVLRGNGSTLIGAGNFAVVEFQGTLGAYQNLSAAPKYGDISLSGVTGLTGDTMVLLYSGNTRPNDGQQVNFEVLKIKSDGTVYDKVYSDQNGGTPRYAVVTPIKGVEIYGFEFEMGSSTAHGIFIRYAENVHVGNIGMTGGSATTVAIRNTINATIDHVRRIKPSATGSGQGYNVALNVTKYVKVDRVYGEETRHDFDQDSSYVTDVSGVVSVNCLSASIVLSHTGFGGFTSVRDCTIRTNSYAISTSDQVGGGANLMFRHLVIDNINITNNKNMAADDFYVGIYLQYPTENVSIKNVTFKNVNNAPSFDYAGGVYNSSYFAIRAFRPDRVFDVENVVVDAATSVVWVDNLSSSSVSTSRLTIKSVSVDRFRDVLSINAGLNGTGAVSIEDVGYFETSAVYGRAIVSMLATSGRLHKLMIRGLDTIPQFAKTIYLEAGAGCPRVSYIDTAGFVRRLSSLNSLAAGGTITQHEYLTRGDFAVWTSTSKTLSTTVPIERPVTSGNIFAIHNGGSGSLTIPANSNTVTNTADIVIAAGETHYFMANSDGTKWLHYKKETGTSL